MRSYPLLVVCLAILVALATFQAAQAGQTSRAPLAFGEWVNWSMDEVKKTDLSVHLGKHGVNVRLLKLSTDHHGVQLTIRAHGRKTATEIQMDEFVLRGYARLVRFEKESQFPQLILSFYSGGAHCCFRYRLFRLNGESWEKIPFDSNAGPTGSGDTDGLDAIDDINQDGVAELKERDDSFLYRFASYAGSYSPARIYVLDRGRWVDASRNQEYRHLYTYKDADLEKECQVGSNSFWATYVAEQAIIGRLRSAWDRMLKCYNKNEDWGLCKDAEELSNCTTGIRPFPEVLKQHLTDAGYWSTSAQRTSIPNNRCRAFPSPLENGKTGQSWGPACTPEQCQTRKCLGY